MIAPLLIFALITIGCVSAADDIETDDAVAIDDDTIEEEILTDGNNEPGTYTDLVNEISALGPGETLELTRDYTYNASTDSQYSLGIRFTNTNFTIDGKGHTLSGNKEAGGIINNAWYTEIYLKNIIFTDVKAVSSSNFVLYSYGYGEVINCTFINNGGQTIRFVNGFVNLINSSFINNTGRAYAEFGRVENCKFINNTGGGLITQSGSTIKNCTFENNEAQSGGALIITYGASIENCRFINNRATTYSSSYKGGGAISRTYDRETVKIINSVFIDNNDPRGFSFLAFGEWIIHNSTFENNGFEINSSYDVYGKSNMEIENSNFINCNIVNNQGNITLSKNVFENGYIENNGTINSQVYFIVPKYSQPVGNSLILLRLVDDNGNQILDGRIPESLISLSIGDEEINLDDILPFGGNWYYVASKYLPEGNYGLNINVKNQDELFAIYPVNSMSDGALEVGDYSSFADLENAINSAEIVITLTDDYTFDIAGGFDKNGILIDRDNIIIDGNGHTINAATVARIFNITGQNVTLRNINFYNGFADKGGAVYSLSDVTIEHCNFTNNLASEGGAIYIANANIIDSIFTENRAYYNGGAAYIIGESSIIDSTFTSNDAKKGLAILNAALLNIENTKFEDGNLGDEIILILDGNVILKNVTPKELNPVYCVDLYIGGYYSFVADYTGQIVTYDLDNVDEFIYLDRVVFDIIAMNEETTLNHGSIIMSIDNGNYSSEIIEGHAIIPMPILDAGTHTIYFTYNGGDKYQKTTAQKEFKIYKKETYIIPDFENREVPEGGIYTASLSTDPDGARVVGEVVIFNIDDMVNVTSITNSDGVAVLTMTPSLVKILGYGSKFITITFDGNNNLEESFATIRIELISGSVIPPAPSDSVNGNGEYSTVITDDSGIPLAGETVVLSIGDRTIATAVTDANGVVTFHIPEDVMEQLQGGNAQITLSYNSNGYPHTIDKNVTIKVNPQIVANAASYVINYGGTYSVTLKDPSGKVLSGKQVTFILNGKNIGSAVTNAKGVASIKLTAAALKTAKAGSRNLVIQFNGDANYSPVAKTVKLTIKKEKTKIAAKKKSFKRATKTKKYTITLKNSKGKAVKKAKVYIKVGKKTYKAKTNSRGKATFKITKLTKKGRYTAKITFKTTAYYLKAVKKVKITVK